MSVFPFRMQHDAMQCGIACLQMVCEYHGRKMSAAEVEELCPSTAEGVSLLGMSRAAEALGLHTVSGRLPVDMLAKAPLPCILHWRQRHFVVLYRLRRKGGKLRYCVADPAKGLVDYGEEEFEDGWLSLRSKGEDKGIATGIKTDLLNHKFGDGWNISVYCYYGHVFLVGEVPPQARNEAITIARRDARVRSVRAHWFDAAASETSDLMLATKLRTELIGTSNLSSTRIDTEVNSGRVVLLGVVANEQERTLAVQTAQRVNGVVRVYNYLMLPEEATPALK